MQMTISHVCHCVLASLGVGALAYSPAVALGLYASLLDSGSASKPAGQRVSRLCSPMASNECDPTDPRAR